MPIIDNVLMKAKFRGCMLGSLTGDCFGGPFEGDSFSHGMKLMVQRSFDQLDGQAKKGPFRKYSDDTVMTKCVAKSLVDKPEIDYTYMAKLFVKEYFAAPGRGYGKNIVDVFQKLRMSNFQDIYYPGADQFRGTGSYGNGGAMRIAPIALFFHDKFEPMVRAATQSTKITHTNSLGVNGALLQCLAVHQSLLLNPADKFDANKFAADLMDKMDKFESDPDFPDEPKPFQTQLQLITDFLGVDDSNPITEEEVIVGLGNEVSAVKSVPTAIYCFLKAHSGMPGIECENVFRRAIQYAITLGGDTDTIAAMTGAIAGAYFGDGIISKSLLDHCEKYLEISDLADELYKASQT